MDASAELHCFGMNLEKIKSLDQKYFEKQKNKFTSLERIYNCAVKVEKLRRSQEKEIKFQSQ
jgi:hypothetical protein